MEVDIHTEIDGVRLRIANPINHISIPTSLQVYQYHTRRTRKSEGWYFEGLLLYRQHRWEILESEFEKHADLLGAMVQLWVDSHPPDSWSNVDRIGHLYK